MLHISRASTRSFTMVSTSFLQMDAFKSSFSFRRNPDFGPSFRRNGRFSLSSRRRDYEFLEATRDDTRNAATLEMASASAPAPAMENKNSSMAEEGVPRRRKPASFMTRMNAVFRKNLAYQKRNLQGNIALVSFPILLCLLLFSIEKVHELSVDAPENKCECQECIDNRGESSCNYECTSKYFSIMFSPSGISPCPERNPTRWPALVQIPQARFRATRRSSSTSDHYSGVPNESCRENNSCPVTVLLTGSNRSLAEGLGQNLYGNQSFSSSSGYLDLLDISSKYIIGTDTDLPSTYFFEPALTMLGPPLYIIQQKCNPKFFFPVAIKMDGLELVQELRCVQGLNLWRNSSTDIAREILTSYSYGNSERKINEILAAYDFSNTGDNIFNVTFWYNGTYKDNGPLLRIPRASNAASNSYLHFFKGANVKLLLDFVKEMPKGETSPTGLNISSTISPLLLTWVIQLLFPVILANLVNEKQSTRMFMKMHGLGDIPYWMISYAYFLLLSSVNMLFLVMLGSLIGIKTFILNDYSIQSVFYFISENLQISLAFLASTLFSNVKTATVSGYLYVFGSGFLGYLLFQDHHQHAYHPEELLQLMEIFPGLSLYRGLHELAEFAYRIDQFGVPQILWKDVSKDNNRLGFILLTMMVEWPMLLLVTYYLDQVLPYGGEVKRHPLWFLTSSLKRKKTNLQQCSRLGKENDDLLNMDRPDISQEREAVERSLQGSSINYGIICDNLKKVHPSKNGNNEKHAVRGLSLALCQGECFGLLGPSGAGKTSFVNMMTGLATPTSGAAFLQGLDIMADMDKIYSSMGVCPQNNLLWDTLTGKEHLLFYGRLKNLSEDELTKEVEDMLKKTKLFDRDIADKLLSEYSGGMKRKLSVAISFIGNPKVVYMDEPTRGLDPTSRKDVWTMLQKEKHDKTIVITTCSVEETDALCDRVGIFVNGSLECLGSPRELKLRYGGFYILTMRTPSAQEDNVEKLVCRLSPRAKKVFHFSGTQKFHLPKQEIRATDVFNMIGNAKKGLAVHTWGLTSTSLEDVFRSSVEGASPTR